MNFRTLVEDEYLHGRGSSSEPSAEADLLGRLFDWRDGAWCEFCTLLSTVSQSLC